MKIKTAPTSSNNKVSTPSVRRTIARLLGYSGVIALLWASPSRADEVADVSKLLRAGKVTEALVKTNEFLAKHPADPQMRFMKGVLLTEQNKSEEAIVVFTKLTEDYRDLPEPYNNLAVLYAANGQYDKARIALEKAIRTNPSYMTAYENLGDVYGKMASQAYDKALALGANNAPAKSKLTLLRTFSSSTGAKVTVPETQVAQAGAAPAPASVPARPAANAPVQLITPLSPNTAKAMPPQRIPALSVTPPAVAAKPAPAPAPTPMPAPVLAKVEPPKPAPMPVPAPVPAKPAAPVVLAKVEPAKPMPAPAPAPAKVEPVKPAPAPVKVEPAKPAPAPVLAKVETPKAAAKAEPAKPDNSENDAVLKQVHGWAKAWSSQNVDGYLGYYANEFEPPKGLSRKAWADERRARIAGKGRIHVEIATPEVDVHGNTAKVTFRQTYESDRLTARSRKTLVLIKNGGKWQIKQESSGS
ncbi:L,D-transpeptidase Cds6 family protein [Rugamonas apoptosis]|uniref:Tetratricopeptide repeat protein n=1 Tax=Rugamonas apoptosis TaxID=2758570 RepID=A0A7W2IMZ6_9BURK|nr:tetratricopeptide repeat protein [Rugamonas apoptosis]MBA5690169.1 tetratricopeptide repeat protein [Rugamonas apoptosis]